MTTPDRDTPPAGYTFATRADRWQYGFVSHWSRTLGRWIVTGFPLSIRPGETVATAYARYSAGSDLPADAGVLCPAA